MKHQSCGAIAGALAALLIATVPAGALQIGVRGGYAKADGEIFDGSGSLGSGGLYGLVGSLPLLPMIDLEFAYERYTADFDFDRVVQDQPFSTDAEYLDHSYLLTAKLSLVDPAGTPFGLYAGAGGSLHAIDLELDDDFDLPGFDTDENEFAWHIVAGLDLRLPSLPMLLYAEYRFQELDIGDKPRFNSIYAGLNLVLE